METWHEQAFTLLSLLGLKSVFETDFLKFKEHAWFGSAMSFQDSFEFLKFIKLVFS